MANAALQNRVLKFDLAAESPPLTSMLSAVVSRLAATR
jgi:hypothetical protein